MPITIQVDKSRDLTIFSVEGFLSFDIAMPVVKAFYDDNPTRHVIWDMTDTTEIQFTSNEVQIIATFKPRIRGKRELGKTAFVAQRDILFGLSRMFEAHSSIVNSPYPVKVVRSIEEAYQWLDET